MKNPYTLRILILCIAAISSAAGQTKLDLRTQSSSVDFSAIPGTKPFQSGSTLPATCSVGQMFFLTSATTGQNSYGCSAANVWAQQSAGLSGTTVDTSGIPVGTRSTIHLSTPPRFLL